MTGSVTPKQNNVLEPILMISSCHKYIKVDLHLIEPEDRDSVNALNMMVLLWKILYGEKHIL